MVHFCALQSTYQTIEYALYYGKQPIESGSLDKLVASSRLVPSLKELLTHTTCTLHDLAFIVVNRGPAPFTTLRTLIATVNGIQFARRVPLIGVDGFDVWFSMLPESGHDTAIIMNAFNQEVYVGLRRTGSSSTHQSWYGPVGHVIHTLTATITTKLLVAGNALPLYRHLFQQEISAGTIIIDERDLIPHALPYVASLGLQAWHDDQQRAAPLSPLYLKTTM